MGEYSVTAVWPRAGGLSRRRLSKIIVIVMVMVIAVVIAVVAVALVDGYPFEYENIQYLRYFFDF